MANPTPNAITGIGGGSHTSVTYTSSGPINTLHLVAWTKVNSSANPSVVSVSSTSFSSSQWKSRKQFQVTHSGELLEMSSWWVPVAAGAGQSLSGEVITISQPTGNSGLSLIAFGMSNVSSASPFDVNATVPNQADNPSSSSVPTSGSVSSASSTPTGVAFVGTSLNQTLGSNPGNMGGNAMTFGIHEHSSNGGPDTDLGMEYQQAASAYAATTATWGVSLSEWTLYTDVFAPPPPTPSQPAIVFTNVYPHQ